MNKRKDIFNMAIQLLAESGYDQLTAAQSWNKKDYLTKVEIAKHDASSALFALADLLD